MTNKLTLIHRLAEVHRDVLTHKKYLPKTKNAYNLALREEEILLKKLNYPKI